MDSVTRLQMTCSSRPASPHPTPRFVTRQRAAGSVGRTPPSWGLACARDTRQPLPAKMLAPLSRAKSLNKAFNAREHVLMTRFPPLKHFNISPFSASEHSCITFGCSCPTPSAQVTTATPANPGSWLLGLGWASEQWSRLQGAQRPALPNLPLHPELSPLLRSGNEQAVLGKSASYSELYVCKACPFHWLQIHRGSNLKVLNKAFIAYSNVWLGNITDELKYQ